MGDCNIWAVFDFGRGPVYIRCTQEGAHENHECHIQIDHVEDSASLERLDEFHHRNIFERNEKPNE